MVALGAAPILLRLSLTPLGAPLGPSPVPLRGPLVPLGAPMKTSLIFLVCRRIAAMGSRRLRLRRIPVFLKASLIPLGAPLVPLGAPLVFLVC